MTFGDAVNGLTNGKAAKRPSWGGYVKKTVTSNAGVEPETYTLTFKNRSGTTYEYTWNGSAWTAPSTKVPFDEEIMAAMIADDWQVGNAADYDAMISGTSVW